MQMRKKFVIQVVFGKEACRIHREEGFAKACEYVGKTHDGMAEYRIFNTLYEARAYKRGVRDCHGKEDATMSVILPVVR